MFCFGINLGGIGLFQPQNIPRKLNNCHLHAKTKSQIRDSVFAAKLNLWHSVFVGSCGGNVVLAAATTDVVDRGINLGQTIKGVSGLFGGSGGGKREFAQTGFKDPSIEERLIDALVKAVQEELKLKPGKAVKGAATS